MFHWFYTHQRKLAKRKTLKPEKYFFFIDEIDVWADNNYPDLFRALAFAESHEYKVYGLSGTPFTSDFAAEKRIWINLLRA